MSVARRRSAGVSSKQYILSYTFSLVSIRHDEVGIPDASVPGMVSCGCGEWVSSLRSSRWLYAVSQADLTASHDVLSLTEAVPLGLNTFVHVVDIISKRDGCSHYLETLTEPFSHCIDELISCFHVPTDTLLRLILSRIIIAS